jgi:hypothetical protein
MDDLDSLDMDVQLFHYKKARRTWKQCISACIDMGNLCPFVKSLVVLFIIIVMWYIYASLLDTMHPMSLNSV